MKRWRVSLTWVVLVLSAIASTSAFAWRGGVRFGVFVGPGFWYPPPYYYGYGYPYYYPPYYPPVVVAPAPIYIEQGAAAPALASPLTQGYWYYCDESKAYYPYTKECPAGWQRVAPQPAN